MSFNVQVKKKSSSHPWYCPKLPQDQQPQCSDAGYTIDGQGGRVLFLKRGQTYTFDIDAPGHPFYFTSDPVGAKRNNDPKSLTPQNQVTDQGTLTVTVDESFPDSFYYQCQIHPRMGGRVQISVDSNYSPSEWKSPTSYDQVGYSGYGHSPNYSGYYSPSNYSGKMVPYGLEGSGGSRKEYLMDLARLAVSYGFVPIPIFNKTPRFKGWQNTRHDSNDPEKTVRRVGHLVDAGLANNLGIVTGEASGVVVVDVDLGSVDWFNELARLNGGLPKTFTVLTGNNGYHVYFRYEPRVQHLGNMNKIGGQNIDFRTNGGQAIFPGSISDKTGQTYQVVSGYENNIPQIAEIPDWLLQWLTQNQK